MARSILAVVAGVFLWGMLWVAAQAALAAAMPGSFRDDGSTGDTGILVLLLAIAGVISISAGYVTVKLARRDPWRHAIALTAVQFTIAVAVQSAWWEVLPVWYHLAFFVLVATAHPFGGRLAAQQSRRLLQPS